MSHPRRRFSVHVMAATSAALTVVVVAPAVPAQAVPPSNDAATKAAVITTVPATILADTREATTDRVDRDCVFGRSVWYRYTPPTTSRVKMVTIGSSYDTVLAVYHGRRAPSTLRACNDDAIGLASAVRPRLTAGQNYWIAVSSFGPRRPGPGGDLVLRVGHGGAPAIHLSVQRAEAGAISGRLRIHGTISCDTPSVVYGELEASQAVGQNVARGWGWLELDVCETEPTEWMVRVDSETGWAFQPGTVAADAYAEGYDGFSEVSTTVEANLPVIVDPHGRAGR